MTRPQMTDKVIQVIRDFLETDRELTADTDLRDELCLNSFDMVNIMIALEDDLGISIEYDDFRGIYSIWGVADLLLELV